MWYCIQQISSFLLCTYEPTSFCLYLMSLVFVDLWLCTTTFVVYDCIHQQSNCLNQRLKSSWHVITVQWGFWALFPNKLNQTNQTNKHHHQPKITACQTSLQFSKLPLGLSWKPLSLSAVNHVNSKLSHWDLSLRKWELYNTIMLGLYWHDWRKLPKPNFYF